MKATKKACMECPFRRTSLPGYLGPWPGPEELIDQAFSEGGFVCHKTIHRDELTLKFKENKYRLCAGSLACANKTNKRYRDPEWQKEQDRIGKPADIMNGFEFIDRHEKKPAKARRRQ